MVQSKYVGEASDLFRSKKFWSAIIGVVMMLVVNFFPEFADNADQLTQSIMIVIGLLIGGYIAQDNIGEAGKVLRVVDASGSSAGGEQVADTVVKVSDGVG